MFYINRITKKLVDAQNKTTLPFIVDFNVLENISFQILNEDGKAETILNADGFYFAGSTRDFKKIIFLTENVTLQNNVLTFNLNTYTQQYLDNIKRKNTEINIELGYYLQNEKIIFLRDTALANPRVYVEGLDPQVLDLSNYYTKTYIDTNYWTKYETAQAIADIETMKIVVVQELPPIAEAEQYTIYLVPSLSSSSGNVYEEYLVINGAYECIGSTAVDLSQYAVLSGNNNFVGDNTFKGNFEVKDNANNTDFSTTPSLDQIGNAGKSVYFWGNKIFIFAGSDLNFMNKNNLGRAFTFTPAYLSGANTVNGSLTIGSDIVPISLSGTLTAPSGISLTDGTNYGKFVQGYAVGSETWNGVGAYSFSGNKAKANGYCAAAFGDTTNGANGYCAFSAGGANGAGGGYAVAFGLGCISSGDKTFTVGDYCRADAHKTVCMGDHNNVGVYALRNSNVCLACYAEGAYNIVTGDTNNLNQYNHVEGYGNTVGKDINNTVISTSYAHVEGQNNYAGDNNQHVAGKFNSATTGARVTGGGSDANNRANIEVLDWNGNLTLAGDLTIQYNGQAVSLSSIIARLEQLEQNA